MERSVLGKIEQHVQRVRLQWDRDYDPNNYFDELRSSVHIFAKALNNHVDVDAILTLMETQIRDAVYELESDYEPPSSSPVPTQQSAAKSGSLDELFRDVDE